jgi:hypothetical protein
MVVVTYPLFMQFIKYCCLPFRLTFLFHVLIFFILSSFIYTRPALASVTCPVFPCIFQFSVFLLHFHLSFASYSSHSCGLCFQSFFILVRTVYEYQQLDHLRQHTDQLQYRFPSTRVVDISDRPSLLWYWRFANYLCTSTTWQQMKISTLVLCSARTRGAVMLHLNALPSFLRHVVVFGRFLVQIRAGRPATLTDIFVDFLSTSRHKLRNTIIWNKSRLLHSNLGVANHWHRCQVWHRQIFLLALVMCLQMSTELYFCAVFYHT